MTAEEKAKALIEEMIENSCTPHPDDYAGNLWDVHTEKAKQCALIVCNEILEVIGYPTYFHETRRFWQLVKEEIEKFNAATN